MLEVFMADSTEKADEKDTSEKKGAFDKLLSAIEPWVPAIVVYIAVIVTVALAIPFFKK
jgi:hypothetical protein